MLTDRYLVSAKGLADFFVKIQQGTAPDKFTLAHLRGIGFTSSNHNGFIPLLKALGFLADDGTPTPRYHAYRDASQAPTVLGEALKEAYGDLFHINEQISERDRDAIIGKFKTTHNTSDRVAEAQAATFLALLPLAKLGTGGRAKVPLKAEVEPPPVDEKSNAGGQGTKVSTTLHYNIQIHLPATKDLDTYNAIFKALRQHLLDG
jgi:hypothetical protein